MLVWNVLTTYKCTHTISMEDKYLEGNIFNTQQNCNNQEETIFVTGFLVTQEHANLLRKCEGHEKDTAFNQISQLQHIFH